ncbi:hypothetical protein Fcan01_26466 [Folsomia candida]|uniref:Uncharacterized protein n=1 Tax=Folsomia candida TaxID=158441 RepID=A0A226D217_FOLCA|nr:hypothetical protein Fcan01_26466 [Folsomia candida]
MLFKIYLSIFLHLIPISDCSKIEITNIDRIFPQSSVLHILGNFNNSYHKFWNRNLFKFLLYNSKFPKLLHHLPNNDIRDNRYYQNCRRTCPKNLGHFATQISIIFLPKLQTREIFYRTQNGLHTCGENPTYMFLVVIIRYFQINLEGKLSSALFVIYHPLKSSTNSVNISVVCYTCRLKLIEVPHPNSGGIDSLYSFWKVQNSNLHGFMIESDGMSQFNPNKETCSAIKRGVRAFSRKFICAQLALGRKLNFTDVAIFGIKYPQYQKDSGHKIFYHFKLAAVSYKKSRVDGFQGFTSPLDVPTWAASGASFLLVSALLAGTKYSKSGVWRDFGSIFSQSMYWIFSCLCGQYHETPAIIRLMGVSSVLFVVLRVLMFFLVGSVFYQGSIFSSLIITLPPILPSTLESLVDSQIQIITTTRVYDSGYRSMLTNFLIDDVINTTKPGSNLFHTLTQVKKRTKFIDSSSSFAVGLSISESLRVKFGSGEVNKVSDTFAVINAENELVEMLSAIGLMGDVHVVRSLEAPIFFINNPICIGGKMLLPLISIGFGQLAQSGLYERWEELENLKILIAQVKALKNRDLYRKAVISRLFRKIQLMAGLLYTVGITLKISLGQDTVAEKSQGLVFLMLFLITVLARWYWPVRGMLSEPCRMLNACFKFEKMLIRENPSRQPGTRDRCMLAFLNLLETTAVLIPLIVVAIQLHNPCALPFLGSMSPYCDKGVWIPPPCWVHVLMIGADFWIWLHHAYDGSFYIIYAFMVAIVCMLDYLEYFEKYEWYTSCGNLERIPQRKSISAKLSIHTDAFALSRRR